MNDYEMLDRAWDDLTRSEKQEILDAHKKPIKMKTALEVLKQHWMTSPGYSHDKTKEFEEFTSSKAAEFMINAFKDYAYQFVNESAKQVDFEKYKDGVAVHQAILDLMKLIK